VRSIISLVLVIAIVSIPSASYALEIDACGTVTRIVDGDTVWMRVETLYEVFPGIEEGDEVKIRFADVNAPEMGTLEGLKSRLALERLLQERGSRLCIDIDDQYVTDKYGRIVAVLISITEEDVEVINSWLVENGYAEYVDYPNEFNPENMSWDNELPNIDNEVVVANDDPPIIIYLFILLLVVILAYKRGIIRAGSG